MTMPKIVAWTAVILWMALIFSLSHQPAEDSNALSKGITKVIVEAIEKVAPEAGIDLKALNNFIRKKAHFLAYLALGVLVLGALRLMGVKGLRGVALALGICVLFAVTDEVHQLFVPGRGGQVSDVLLDSAGACVGIGLYLLIGRVVKGGQPGRQ